MESGIQRISEAMGKRSTYSEKLQKYGVLIAFVLICIGISVMSPNFLTVTNLLIVVRQITINAMLAFGVTFVIISGGIDLSMGSVVAVAGVVAASFAHPGTYPLIVPLMAGLAAGVLIGAFNGIVITKGNVPPFIVTLGTMTIGRGLALIISDGRPISNLSESFGYIGGGNLLGIPFPIVILGVTFAACVLLLKKTVLGRYIYAVGGNEEAARASGIDVKKIKITVYTLCGALSAVGGIILASRISTGQPNVGVAFELDAIAAVVIGGTSLSGGVGTMTGTLIGALLIGVIGNGLDLMNVSSYYQQVVMGLIIIGAVLLDNLRRNNLDN
ncbi:ABC transporter permease [Halalkalibaculum sp. DA3122]|uniref:ABC transporter permease n=1 Tax=unclassified Halalkalibaculum TaxID=2964617 RepID=UPI003754497F